MFASHPRCPICNDVAEIAGHEEYRREPENQIGQPHAQVFIEYVAGLYNCPTHGLYWCSRRHRYMFDEQPKERE